MSKSPTNQTLVSILRKSDKISGLAFTLDVAFPSIVEYTLPMERVAKTGCVDSYYYQASQVWHEL